MKEFSNKWCSLIHSFVLRASVTIKVECVGHYFQMEKNYIGYSLLSMLYNIVAHMLSFMIKCAQINGQIEGELWILQYVDDMILFIRHDLKKN
jgi:hypothetical protein